MRQVTDEREKKERQGEREREREREREGDGMDEWKRVREEAPSCSWSHPPF